MLPSRGPTRTDPAWDFIISTFFVSMQMRTATVLGENCVVK